MSRVVVICYKLGVFCLNITKICVYRFYVYCAKFFSWMWREVKFSATDVELLRKMAPMMPNLLERGERKKEQKKERKGINNF